MVVAHACIWACRYISNFANENLIAVHDLPLHSVLLAIVHIAQVAINYLPLVKWGLPSQLALA